MSINLYKNVSLKISKLITQSYSSSFSFATLLFEADVRKAIYSIYGFVRLADEIVDTFHDFDKEFLLNRLEEDFNYSLKYGISYNPILYSFAVTVKKYDIQEELIISFLKSMKADLYKNTYKTELEINEYIYGSADVVGLMCLKVFCQKDASLYTKLEFSAQKLGSAFQKVNFLRDLKNDTQTLGRFYFPQLQTDTITEDQKNSIVSDIKKDFEIAFQGIKQLPGRSKLAVLIAYFYYKQLLNKLSIFPIKKALESRISVSLPCKLFLFIKAMFIYKLKLI